MPRKKPKQIADADITPQMQRQLDLEAMIQEDSQPKPKKKSVRMSKQELQARVRRVKDVIGEESGTHFAVELLSQCNFDVQQAINRFFDREFVVEDEWHTVEVKHESGGSAPTGKGGSGPRKPMGGKPMGVLRKRSMGEERAVRKRPPRRVGDKERPMGDKERPMRPMGDKERPMRPMGDKERPMRPMGDKERPMRPMGDKERPMRPMGIPQKEPPIVQEKKVEKRPRKPQIQLITEPEVHIPTSVDEHDGKPLTYAEMTRRRQMQNIQQPRIVEQEKPEAPPPRREVVEERHEEIRAPTPPPPELPPEPSHVAIEAAPVEIPDFDSLDLKLQFGNFHLGAAGGNATTDHVSKTQNVEKGHVSNARVVDANTEKQSVGETAQIDDHSYGYDLLAKGGNDAAVAASSGYNFSGTFPPETEEPITTGTQTAPKSGPPPPTATVVPPVATTVETAERVPITSDQGTAMSPSEGMRPVPTSFPNVGDNVTAPVASSVQSSEMPTAPAVPGTSSGAFFAAQQQSQQPQQMMPGQPMHGMYGMPSYPYYYPPMYAAQFMMGPSAQQMPPSASQGAGSAQSTSSMQKAGNGQPQGKYVQPSVSSSAGYGQQQQVFPPPGYGPYDNSAMFAQPYAYEMPMDGSGATQRAGTGVGSATAQKGVSGYAVPPPGDGMYPQYAKYPRGGNAPEGTQGYYQQYQMYPQNQQRYQWGGQ